MWIHTHHPSQGGPAPTPQEQSLRKGPKHGAAANSPSPGGDREGCKQNEEASRSLSIYGYTAKRGPGVDIKKQDTVKCPTLQLGRATTPEKWWSPPTEDREGWPPREGLPAAELGPSRRRRHTRTALSLAQPRVLEGMSTKGCPITTRVVFPRSQKTF